MSGPAPEEKADAPKIGTPLISCRFKYDMGSKWRGVWRDKKLFLFDEKSGKPIYIIDTPPPFTNGALHMGQVFWISYIDAIARYKRMCGFNVLYPQGWDAHGFPTEIAVEKKYGKSLSRQEFQKRCMEESVENIFTMKQQMLNLGASFDERYEYTTTSKDYMAKVQLSILEMYNKGLVYRTLHPVEWCISCATTISREQSIEKEEDSFLNYIDFELKGKKNEFIQIATSRPELIHACVAIAVNPKDERFASFIGKHVLVPLSTRSVPIIGEDNADPTFGTGAEMVCTFGDKQDVSLYYKHKLELIEAMDDHGKLKNAGKFDGMNLKDGRKAVIEALKESHQLRKQEKITHMVKVHDRCSTPDRTHIIDAVVHQHKGSCRKDKGMRQRDKMGS